MMLSISGSDVFYAGGGGGAGADRHGTGGVGAVKWWGQRYRRPIEHGRWWREVVSLMPEEAGELVALE